MSSRQKPEAIGYSINNSYIEQVQRYKYIGSIVNDSNSIEEVKERIAVVERHTTQTLQRGGI